jgi:RimJ/RimL family protein N-acetyltransferase
MPAALPSPQVLLRPVVSDDLPILYAHQSDPVAAAMAAFDARDEATFMAHWTKIIHDPAGLCRTVLADGVVVGNVVAWFRDGEREIGYWIDRAHWGRGIATLAVRALLDLETTRPLHAGTAVGNLGSIAVLTKCGFVPDGEDDGFTLFVLPA